MHIYNLQFINVYSCFSTVVVPSLLLGLGSAVKTVRKGCMECLVVLVDGVSCSSSQLWKEFLQFIVSSDHAIVADGAAITNVLEKYFCSPSSSRKSKGKKLKKVEDRGSVLESLFTWFSSLCTVKGQTPPYYVMLQFLRIFRQLDTEVSEKECLLTVKCITIFSLFL